jgi:pyruvate kinase
MNKIKIIVTLGPATSTEADLRKIKDKGVDFVRINMSHSTLDDLHKFIAMARIVDIPFMIDTEGSQVRSGDLYQNSINIEENQEIKLTSSPIVGNEKEIHIKPSVVIPQLEPGDLINIDFDTLTLRVTDTTTASQGFVTAKAITSGAMGKNKAVVIDSASGKKIILPALSEKDYQAINIGLDEGIGHIAFSFARSGAAVDEVRRASQNTMKIISKIECVDALKNLNEIIEKSDSILIDRGDLSKEIPLEKIPFTQKIILNRAKKLNTEVFVATNLLETMSEKKKPTRAEVHDIINTLMDGASGLVLAGETAVGNYPMECISMLNKLINHVSLSVDMNEIKNKEESFVQKLEDKNYLLNHELSSSLIAPHGGVLINRTAQDPISLGYLKDLLKISLSLEKQMDVEQIALGTYSPLEGFMNNKNVQSVLDNMRLENGLVWSLPITLDVSEEQAATMQIGSDIALTNEKEETIALLHLSEKFNYDKDEMCLKLYNTLDEKHPGVVAVKLMQDVFLAGKITLLKRRIGENKEYELTPRQTRRLFEERGWEKVVGFHTRNVIHKGHEFIQLSALEKENCDGLFVHPVVGKKKKGDFQAPYIIKAYEKMVESFYPKNKVVFGTFSTYSRYAGPREALFTALCRKNFGCSHFVVGRDHTGVGDYYHPKASHNIFRRFPDLGIKAVCFDKVFYSEIEDKHIHAPDAPGHIEEDKLHVSGTQARKMFESGETPPVWFMRPEISKIIVDAVVNGEEVFVP